MSEEFRVVVKAVITYRGSILLGKKQEEENPPISGEWDFLGGHLEHGETIEEAVKREVKEETGLKTEVHHIIDTMTFSWKDEERDSLQILFHCEADSDDVEAKDDLDKVKWVDPENVLDQLGETEAERVRNREAQTNFLEKVQKMPTL